MMTPSLTVQVWAGSASLAFGSRKVFQPVRSLPLNRSLNPSSSFLSAAAAGSSRARPVTTASSGNPQRQIVQRITVLLRRAKTRARRRGPHGRAPGQAAIVGPARGEEKQETAGE